MEARGIAILTSFGTDAARAKVATAVVDANGISYAVGRIAETLGNDIAAKNAVAPFLEAWNPVELKDVARIFRTHEAESAQRATELVTKYGEIGTRLNAAGADLHGYWAFSRQWQGRGANLAMANGNAWMVEDIHRILADGTIEYEEAGVRKVAQVDIASVELAGRADDLSFQYGTRGFQGESILPDLVLEGIGPAGEKVLIVIEHKWSSGTVSYGIREGKQLKKYEAYRDRLASTDATIHLVVVQYRVQGLADDALRLDIAKLLDKGFQLLLFGGV